MIKGNEFDKAVEMKIDTVFTPAERIRMYKEKFSVLGSADIALVRTSSQVLFITDKVMPVMGYLYQSLLSILQLQL